MKTNTGERTLYGLLASFVNDLRYAWRQLRASPGFSFVIVLSLALGIGANTSIFNLVNAVMLRSLPVNHPDRLLQLGWSATGWWANGGHTGDEPTIAFSYPAYEYLRRQTHAFVQLFAFVPMGFSRESASVLIGGQPDTADGEMVSGNYFEGLGVTAIAGRIIADKDDKPGATSVAVISYGFWEHRFGRSPDVVGRPLNIDGLAFTIIGIAPKEFYGLQPGRAPDLWIPLNTRAIKPWGFVSDRTDPGYIWLRIVGRLRDGVTDLQAKSETEVIFRQWLTSVRLPSSPDVPVPRLALPPANKGLSQLREQFSKPLTILVVVVALVLLLTCANIAAMLVARAAGRRGEITVRLALGASRWRIAAQLLAESVLVSAIGGTAGLVVAHWSTPALLLLMSGNTPLPLDLRLNTIVLAFTAGVSLLVGITFGLAPAWAAGRLQLNLALRATSGSVGRLRFGLGKALVITQVAISAVLLIGAGLFLQTLRNFEHESLGFNRNGVLTFGVDGTQAGYKDSRLIDFYGRVLQRFQTLPGVQSASLSQMTLLSGNSNNTGIRLPEILADNGYTVARWNIVGPDFCRTMGMSLLLGRDIVAGDRATTPRVAVINEMLAKRFFGIANPIGRHFMLLGNNAADAFTIVGVVSNPQFGDIHDTMRPQAYVPYTQLPTLITGVYYELKTVGDPHALVTSARTALASIDKTVPMSNIKTQEEELQEGLGQERLFANASGFFGLLALLLAAVGLEGTMAYIVNRRVNEIGVRVALGARPSQIVRGVLSETLAMLLAGLVIGVGVTLLAGRYLGSVLYGVRPHDALTIISAIALLALSALFATCVPARRAARIDPMIALRTE